MAPSFIGCPACNKSIWRRRPPDRRVTQKSTRVTGPSRSPARSAPGSASRRAPGDGRASQPRRDECRGRRGPHARRRAEGEPRGAASGGRGDMRGDAEGEARGAEWREGNCEATRRHAGRAAAPRVVGGEGERVSGVRAEGEPSRHRRPSTPPRHLLVISSSSLDGLTPPSVRARRSLRAVAPSAGRRGRASERATLFRTDPPSRPPREGDRSIDRGPLLGPRTRRPRRLRDVSATSPLIFGV